MATTPHQKALLKVQLLNSFNTLGFHQELKKQLRIQICQKLKQKNLIKADLSHEDKLYNRIMASLISQYLVISDCGYSNSIYVAESGYDMKTLDRNQIIEVMGLGQNQLQENISILQNITKKKFPFSGGTLKSIGVQTTPQNIGYSLQQRLALIDKQYRNNISNTSNKQESDNKKKLEQLQADLKRTYERDIQRFKQFEAHNIKVKVSQQWRKKFEQYSKNIHQQYRRKFQNLRKRQRLMEDDIVNKRKVLDQKINGTQKTFLQKIDILDIKSSTIEQTRRNLQIQRKRIKQQYSQIQKQIKAKSRQYDNLLLNLNDKIQYQVGVAKLAIQQQYQEKNAQFLSRKKYIDQQYGKLMGIKQANDLIKQQNKRLFDENMRLRADLTTLQKQLRISVSENATKSQRLDSIRSQILKLQKQKLKIQESLKQITKKYKNRQSQLTQVRNQLDVLRLQNQKRMKSISQQSSLYDQDNHQDPRKLPQIFEQQSKIGLQAKLDLLKKQRKKEIERLKRELL